MRAAAASAIFRAQHHAALLSLAVEAHRGQADRPAAVQIFAVDAAQALPRP